MQPPAVSSVPSASAVALTTNTPANVTSLTLAPGTYLVWGSVDASLTGATLTSLISSLSLNSGALSPQSGSTVTPVGTAGARLAAEPIAQLLENLTTTTGSESLDVGPTILTVNGPVTIQTAGVGGSPPPTYLQGTATLYLVAQATFSAGSVGAYGSLFALPISTPASP